MFILNLYFDSILNITLTKLNLTLVRLIEATSKKRTKVKGIINFDYNH